MLRTGLAACLTYFLMGTGCQSPTAEEQEPVHTDGLVQRTESYYNEQIEKEPTNHRALYGRAEHYFNVGHFERAIADLDRAMQLAPDSFAYVLSLANIYMDALDPNLELPDSRKAIDILKVFTGAHPAHAEAIMELANVYLYIKQYAELQAEMDKLIAVEPYNADAWYFKGIGYSLAGDTANAVKCLQSSLGIDPIAPDVHYELGLLLYKKNPRLAMTYFDHAYRLDSSFSDAAYMKGFLLQRQGKLDEAMSVYKHIAKTDLQFAKAHYNMGYIWLERDTLDKAYRAFDRAIALSPDYTDAYYMRGLVAEKQGNPAQAKLDYTHALNLDPSYQLAADGYDRLKDKP